MEGYLNDEEANRLAFFPGGWFNTGDMGYIDDNGWIYLSYAEAGEDDTRGGAVARTMLMQAAANEWQVPVAELSVADSIITHAASGRKTSYGKVAAAAAKLPVPDAKSIVLKDPRTWKVAAAARARVSWFRRCVPRRIPVRSAAISLS